MKLNQILTYLTIITLSFGNCLQTTQAKTEHTETKQQAINDNLKNDLAVIFGQKNDENTAATADYSKWQNSFLEYLVQSDDDFSMAMALASRVSAVQNLQLTAKIQNNDKLQQQLSELSYQPIADAVNLLITQETLSSETLDILTSLCFHEAMKDHCHANVLLKKRMESDSENLQAYLRPFDMARQAGQRQTMDKLIVIMANTKHSHSVIKLTPKMTELIENYVAEHPLPDSFIEQMTTNYKQLSGVSETMKKQLKTKMSGFMPYFIKNNLTYHNDLPPYRSILDYCKIHIAAISECRQIAQIMLNSSNTMIDKGIAHAIQIATYELERDAAGLQEAQTAHDQFKASYECIIKSNHNPHHIDNQFDPAFQKIAEDATSEYQIMLQTAEYRYQKLKAQGKTAIDPNTCLASQ